MPIVGQGFSLSVCVKTRITIIEDDDDLRGLMCVPLRAAGYDVIALSDGSNLLGERESLSHLYLIDLNLGAISGLEICKGIKSLKYSEGTPVVIIISANPDIRQMAAEARADDTLSKPFSAKALLNKISSYFPEALVA